MQEITNEIEEIFKTKKQMIESEYANIVEVNDSARDIIENRNYRAIRILIYFICYV